MSKRVISKPRTEQKTVYLDIEAIAAWFNLGGIEAKTSKTVTDKKTAITIELKINGLFQQPLVPLVPYNCEYESISTKEVLEAIEMSKATMKEVSGTLFQKNYTNILDALVVYVKDMSTRFGSEQFYKMLNEVNQVVGKRVAITTTEQAYGPKGTAIHIVSLLFGGDHPGKIICSGSRYQLYCTKVRFIETVIKCAGPEMAQIILQKYFKM